MRPGRSPNGNKALAQFSGIPAGCLAPEAATRRSLAHFWRTPQPHGRDPAQQQFAPGLGRHDLRLPDPFALQEVHGKAVAQAAGFGDQVQQETAGDLFFLAAAAPALGQFERPGDRGLGGLSSQMHPMWPSLGTIRGQTGRASHPGKRGMPRGVARGSTKGGHGHGPGRGRRAGLVGLAAEPLGQGRVAIGDRCGQHTPRGPGHVQQLGNGLASASGANDHEAGPRLMDLPGELLWFPRHSGRFVRWHS